MRASTRTPRGRNAAGSADQPREAVAGAHHKPPPVRAGRRGGVADRCGYRRTGRSVVPLRPRSIAHPPPRRDPRPARVSPTRGTVPHGETAAATPAPARSMPRHSASVPSALSATPRTRIHGTGGATTRDIVNFEWNSKLRFAPFSEVPGTSAAPSLGPRLARISYSSSPISRFDRFLGQPLVMQPVWPSASSTGLDAISLTDVSM